MEIFGLAILASVILYLAVTHKGFRKIVLWAGAVLSLCAIAGSLYLWHRNRVQEAAQAVKSVDFPIISLQFSPEQPDEDTRSAQNGALAAYNNAYADLIRQCVYGRIQDVKIVHTEVGEVYGGRADDPYKAYGGAALSGYTTGVKLEAVCHVDQK